MRRLALSRLMKKRQLGWHEDQVEDYSMMLDQSLLWNLASDFRGGVSVQVFGEKGQTGGECCLSS